LSIHYFWSVGEFHLLWAGPQPPALQRACRTWASSLGMLFKSLMLWMPSWGADPMVLTHLARAWHKVARRSVLKFFRVRRDVSTGMATFEDRCLSIKKRLNAFPITYTELEGSPTFTPGATRVERCSWDVGYVVLVVCAVVPKPKNLEPELSSLHFWIGTRRHSVVHSSPDLRRRSDARWDC